MNSSIHHALLLLLLLLQSLHLETENDVDVLKMEIARLRSVAAEKAALKKEIQSIQLQRETERGKADHD